MLLVNLIMVSICFLISLQCVTLYEHYVILRTMCHSLRALCQLEKTEYSKVIFQDISVAIQKWINILCDHSFTEVNRHAIASETLQLLYHMFYFLSAKGCLQYHYDIYRLIIELFMLENLSLEKIVAMIWEFRRFSHTSCCSPINEPFTRS